jgi:hypothetical protein
VCGLRYTTPTSELTPPPKCSTDCPGEEQRHEMTLPAADSTTAWAAGQRGVPTGLPRVAGLGGREDGLGWRHGDRAGTQLAHVGRRVRDGCTAWCLGRPRTRRATLWRQCARSTITATRPSRARRRRGEHGEYGVYGVGTREARRRQRLLQEMASQPGSMAGLTSSGAAARGRSASARRPRRPQRR